MMTVAQARANNSRLRDCRTAEYHNQLRHKHVLEVARQMQKELQQLRIQQRKTWLSKLTPDILTDYAVLGYTE